MSEGAWFRRWFGKEYLELYPHRDEEEAERAVALLLDRVSWEPSWQVLDLACGAGRHLAALRSRGLRAVGLDLSWHLLHQSRTGTDSLPVVRGDMRFPPFADGGFQLVTSFFTSFGYFEAEADDRRVLREVRRMLRPGGYFLLDFLNASQVVEGLKGQDVRSLGGREVVQDRALIEGGRYVEKRIRITDPKTGAERSFLERVRLYRPEELEGLFKASGLEVEARFGDYGGGTLEVGSPRCILLGRAA